MQTLIMILDWCIGNSLVVGILAVTGWLTVWRLGQELSDLPYDNSWGNRFSTISWLFLILMSIVLTWHLYFILSGSHLS